MFLDNIKISIANSLNEKIEGLMNKKNITEGLFIQNCNSIHTFNMFDNIDILFLDFDNKIIFKFINTPINQIIIVNKKTNVLELPKYTSLKYKINDKLIFKFKNVI